MKGGAFHRFSLCFLLACFLEFKLVHLRVVQAAAREKRNGISGMSLQSSNSGKEMNRIGSECSKDDVIIFQGQTTPLPDGIPTYIVQILNSCASDCSISNIHMKCGWFSSARLVNPRIFRRVSYDDCLVDNGQALGPGQTLSFQYANTFPYPLSVSSVTCSS
ncbi:TPD1 protein homolog 1-like isoform X2 [Benincasa hispida]|uniref:TPD1 protein homolog 1-like isoform X2 n=1 Tax=Benincasa hispida TaxID=102211 RepID=UPI0019011C58|nr:TPD1 protein homolog 1-like isoform X2 [Benincasa hispida]